MLHVFVYDQGYFFPKKLLISTESCTFVLLKQNVMKNRLIESAPLLRLAVSLMAGIVMGQCLMTGVTSQQLWSLLAGMIVLTLLLWRYHLLQSLAICACFVVLGWLLISLSKPEEWPEEEVVYEAVAMSHPIEKPKTMAVDIMLTGNGRELTCYLYKDERSRAVKIGDGLEIQSVIKDHRTFVRSRNWRKSQVSLEHLPMTARTRLFFLKLRSQLLTRFHTADAERDAYAVIAAMVLGDKSALTKELKDVYAVTGTSHILALSGLHLGIIYALLSLMVVGRRWRFVSQVIIVLAVWAFVFLVGMSTSVVRSAVMLSIYAVLSLGHREKMSVNTLAFTAVVMLMVNPLSLFDVGFQLSFMAVLSILLWYPVFEGMIPQPFLMSHRLAKWLWTMLAVSCAAQLGTAPLVAYYFGRFSTLFLMTNLVVIPATTLILYLSLIVLFVPSLAYLLNNIVTVLNAFLERVAGLPWASIEGLSPTVLQTTMVYVVIAAVYILVDRFFKRTAWSGWGW